MSELTPEVVEELIGTPDMVPIADAPGYYAHRSGVVVSTLRHPLSIPLQAQIDDRGYSVVGLTIDGKRKIRRVHRIIAKCFLPPRPSPKHEIRHLNGHKPDNGADNLMWGTRSENMLDAVRHGTHRGGNNGRRTAEKRRGELSGNVKLTALDVSHIRLRRARGERVSSIHNDYPHLSKSHLSVLSRGLCWKHIPMPEQANV